jgi:phosphate transport system permease protein
LTDSTNSNFKTWWQSGAPWIWLNAGAVSASILVVFGLIGLIAVRGMSHFWPADIQQIEYADAAGKYRIVGELVESEDVSREQYIESGLGDAPEGHDFVKRLLVKTGNREILSADFRWIDDHRIQKQTTPEKLVVVERVEWGNLYGYLQSVSELGKIQIEGPGSWNDLEARLGRVSILREKISELEKGAIGAINYQLERFRLQRKKLKLDGQDTKENLAGITIEEKVLDAEYQDLRKELIALQKEISRDSAHFEIMNGKSVELQLSAIVSVLQPNNYNTLDKLGRYFVNFYNFMVEEPREANTEGGIFPAIFGTVMMVLLMSVLVTPLGVIAAVYLREYAKQGALIRLIRIAVNNLAGVPSIVYGVFGLGFFVYFLGGNIDQLFYAEASPAPTFGTPGLMWASLTLALLTLPVVIVSTEEGLARIPGSFREGSLALGATKFETLWKIVLPMSSPAIMTGLILAVARAAGEVAPLMLVGVVKLAPELPLDGNSPFLHLDRKFMHLGFHIYDVGFQSPNVEAARPLVYATAFLLVLVIVLLNLSAILMRNHLREKYKALDA